MKYLSLFFIRQLGKALALALFACNGVALAHELTFDCDKAESFSVLNPVQRDAAQGKSIEARAVWLNSQSIRWADIAETGDYRLYSAPANSSGLQINIGEKVRGAEEVFLLNIGALEETEAQFRYLAAGVNLQLGAVDAEKLKRLLKGDIVLVHQDVEGKVQHFTRVQHGALLDNLYPNAAQENMLGATLLEHSTEFKLWAPTARRVALCIYPKGEGSSNAVFDMQPTDETGVWTTTLPKRLDAAYYLYVVEVYVPNVGLVRNRVTDPYSFSLTTDSLRSYVMDFQDERLKPTAWNSDAAPTTVKSATDMSIYELHVRDFSISDNTVMEKYRGKYMAFTESQSNGMKHLKALADAGLTDIHLLPVFDIASIPERDCVTPLPRGSADSQTQQEEIAKYAEFDCYNWGYDPLHYTAPEGSYATDAANGATRVLEFRRMVQALHQTGLRVGMDVVYNHTPASGQHRHSVLDKIVPSYYQRLDANGGVETSSCCANTATERMMMGKLMVDSVLTWARQYHIDSFRFDLMGHQPKVLMVLLKNKLKAEMSKEIQLIGEGWNFGEVSDGARFVQASQLSLNNTGIGTFSDRARDALRGGAPSDKGIELVKKQGYINGLHYEANEAFSEKSLDPSTSRVSGAGEARAENLLGTADMVRVGLAGSLKDYVMTNHLNKPLKLSEIDYNAQPAGYASQPDEVVNYVENHDNQTLFDINVLRLPIATSTEDRARAQILGVALTMFSQGIPYFHAGVDLLRSKSLDRNSYDSGDWFNRLDFTYQDNNFGVGLPPKGDNGNDWEILKPFLANKSIKPSAKNITWTRDAFRDLLRIRASSSLFRLRTAEDVQQRLKFFNTGANQIPTVIVAHLEGQGYAGAKFQEILYAVNVDKKAHTLSLPSLVGKSYKLHPVHTDSAVADKRVQVQARWDSTNASLSIPARTALAYIID